MNWELAQELKQKLPQIHTIVIRDSGGLFAYIGQGQDRFTIRWFPDHNIFDVLQHRAMDTEWIASFETKEALIEWVKENAF